MVFDDAGREIATVGIFSDLRERMRMEERLAKAQEKLAVSEKQTVAIELAGAAAHELNQPLTSVMGYAQMMLRKLEPDSPQDRALETILSESERMAGIVRQLGSLTRYETKSYVGGARSSIWGGRRTHRKSKEGRRVDHSKATACASRGGRGRRCRISAMAPLLCRELKEPDKRSA